MRKTSIIEINNQNIFTEKFIFDMYDTDGLGCIETKEVDTFIKDIYGRDYLTNQNVQR